MVKTIGDGDKTDFDETRRLIDMALQVTKTKRYNLVATLQNSLAHHHAVDDLDEDEIGVHIVNVVEGTDTDGASAAWLRSQRDRITQELGD